MRAPLAAAGLAAALFLVAAGCRRATAPVASCPALPTTRERVALLEGWRFLAREGLRSAESPGLDDRSWAEVRLPHTWGAQPRRSAWYRRHLAVSAADLGGRVYLHFEGAATIADVYLNGVHLGQHRGAFTRFTFDATPHLRAGDNVLAVRTNNHPEDTADCLPSGLGKQLYHLYGGLYRKVWLVKTPRLHIDPTDHASSGVYVTASEVSGDSARLSVRVRVRNAGEARQRFAVRARLCDRGAGQVALLQNKLEVEAGTTGEATLAGRVDRPRLWSPADPYLYGLSAELLADGQVVDAVGERTGFRDFAFREGAFFLNGAPILLRGVGKHQETERSLSAVSDEELREDFANLKDLGVNCVRLAHYPHAPLAYDLADEQGLLVWAENGHSNNRKSDGTGELITREMVRQNYNHPSIVIWSVGNETGFVRVNRYAGLAKSEDPGRLIAYASNTGTRGKRRYPSLDLIAHNVYPGWYSGRPWDFQRQALGLRYLAEAGAGAVVTNHTDHPETGPEIDRFEPEEYRQLVAETHFQTVFRDHAEQVPMYLLWILRDFAIDKYKGRNTKGLLTYSNLKKDAYYLYRSFLRPRTPLVHLASKTYFLRRGRPDYGIKAYSNRDSLRLVLNGLDQGPRRNGQYRHANGRAIANVFHWPAALRPGRNEVSVSDGQGHSDSAVIHYAPPSGAGPAATGEPDPAALVRDLRSSNPSSAAFFIDQPARPQWPFYWEFDGKADNTFDEIPPELQGARWISTPRLSKPGARTDLSLRLARPAEVFVMATRGRPLPPGLLRAGFRDTGRQGLWRDNELRLVAYVLHRKQGSTGERIAVPGATADYVVLVREGEPVARATGAR